jgi:hypothetical protein
MGLGTHRRGDRHCECVPTLKVSRADRSAAEARIVPRCNILAGGSALLHDLTASQNVMRLANASRSEILRRYFDSWLSPCPGPAVPETLAQSVENRGVLRRPHCPEGAQGGCASADRASSTVHDRPCCRPIMFVDVPLPSVSQVTTRSPWVSAFRADDPLVRDVPVGVASRAVSCRSIA